MQSVGNQDSGESLVNQSRKYQKMKLKNGRETTDLLYGQRNAKKLNVDTEISSEVAIDYGSA